MSLKKKVLPLATVVILGLGSLGIANAAIPEDLLHPKTMAENMRQLNMPMKMETEKTSAPTEKVTITTKKNQTVANKDTKTSRNASTASFVYMDAMAKQMAEHMDEMSGAMQDMGQHMNENMPMGMMDGQMSRHMEDMDGQMSRHMEDMDGQMSRHMENADGYMKGMGSHMGR